VRECWQITECGPWEHTIEGVLYQARPPEEMMVGSDLKDLQEGCAWWFMPIIPALGKLRWGNCEFQASLAT
jgi:hypothetical protein